MAEVWNDHPKKLLPLARERRDGRYHAMIGAVPPLFSIMIGGSCAAAASKFGERVRGSVQQVPHILVIVTANIADGRYAGSFQMPPWSSGRQTSRIAPPEKVSRRAHFARRALALTNN